MAAGDLTFSKSAFVSGETVNLFAVDVTPSLPDVSLALSAVAAADGSAAFTAVPATMSQHGVTVGVVVRGVGATSGRKYTALAAR